MLHSATLLGLFLPPHPVKVQVGRLLSKVLPWIPLPNEVVPENLCRDPQIIRAYKDDPMCFTNITSRWGREMFLKELSTPICSPSTIFR